MKGVFIATTIYSVYGTSPRFAARYVWTQNYLEWLKGLEFQGEVLKVRFESLIELYEYLTEQLTNPSNRAEPLL
jgi:hypothetical protein